MVPRAIALLAAVSIIAPAGLSVAKASAATVTSVSYGGREAGATFESVDGCMQRSAFVFVSEGIWREGQVRRTQRPHALVSLAQTNTCTGMGTMVFGHADLEPGDLTVRGDLGAGSLRATVLVRPFQEAPATRVTFDLEWHGAGDVVRRTWTAKSRWDDTMDVAHELRWYRPAVASGSISDGLVDYTTGTPSLTAALSSSKIGDIEISR